MYHNDLCRSSRDDALPELRSVHADRSPCTRQQASAALARRVTALAEADRAAHISGELVAWDDAAQCGRAVIVAHLQAQGIRLTYTYEIRPLA